jgi:hypothetical protein
MTYASAVSPNTCKAAHFHDPLSFHVVATVTMQGTLMRQKSMMERA